ncbi:MAG: lactonase family protein [Candidatus Bathyarchaeia archaeon]
MSEKVLVFVGTYTFKNSVGIYTFELDSATGGLNLVNRTFGVKNPSFLAIDPKQKFLYSVNEIADFEGKPSGGVSAFSIDAETGELNFLNTKPSLGMHPCHLCVDKTGRFVLVANYSSGSVAVLPIKKDGSLDDPIDFIQHHGSSINKKRQEGPHAHSVTLDMGNHYAFVADLGLDKILIYKFDSVKGKLIPNDEPCVQVKPGAGPRHFTFSPDEKFAFLINELNSTIVTFSYDKNHGTLKEIQTVPALPKDFKGISHCADIHVLPSGMFLYGSNRGHDSIVTYAIDKETGKLTYICHESTRGRTPRNFIIDPTGNFLLAANQDSDTIVPFRIDQHTGKLSPTEKITEVPTPVCLKMMNVS